MSPPSLRVWKRWDCVYPKESHDLQLFGEPSFHKESVKLPGGEWEATIEPQRAGLVPVP